MAKYFAIPLLSGAVLLAISLLSGCSRAVPSEGLAYMVSPKTGQVLTLTQRERKLIQDP